MASMTPEFSSEPVALESNPDRVDERVVIFTLNGEEFSIPKRQRPNIGLRFLFEMKTMGEAMASANLLETALGRDAFLALAAHDDLTVEQNERIQRMILAYVMGDTEPGKAR